MLDFIINWFLPLIVFLIVLGIGYIFSSEGKQ